MDRSSVNIVWFKRDLRLQDHQPLQRAAEKGKPILLLYFFEPSLMQYADSDIRHHRFVQQSIAELNQQLQPYGHHIYTVHSEVIPALQLLLQQFNIDTLFSHQETGNWLSYQRDTEVAVFCRNNAMLWNEYPANGIIRPLNNRRKFTEKWLQTMKAPLFSVSLDHFKTIALPEEALSPYTIVHEAEKLFQPGGVATAEKYLRSFLFDRKTNYSRHISKPELSRKSCSRLSPYLAWGNLSMKQVYRESLEAMKVTGDKKNISFFINRLHWHCHFIQKFETECRMEFENLNTGFNGIRNEVNPAWINAWETGQTGYPLIDACMRCVVRTGCLNFRMRSMVVSFFTHHLWQPWQAGVHFLARQFLDYEPGIHYPQFQMQAGTMGVNTIRIYNPVKQGQDHDVSGDFIKKWVPELANIPAQHIHQPWLMTAAEQLMYKTVMGKDYPLPIVDLKTSSQYARVHLWGTKKSALVKEKNERILRVHTKRKTEKETPLQLNFGSSIPSTQ
jgi:deoxyribodipyrimidine photo-lyase